MSILQRKTVSLGRLRALVLYKVLPSVVDVLIACGARFRLKTGGSSSGKQWPPMGAAQAVLSQSQAKAKSIFNCYFDVRCDEVSINSDFLSRGLMDNPMYFSLLDFKKYIHLFYMS